MSGLSFIAVPKYTRQVTQEACRGRLYGKKHSVRLRLCSARKPSDRLSHAEYLFYVCAELVVPQYTFSWTTWGFQMPYCLAGHETQRWTQTITGCKCSRKDNRHSNCSFELFGAVFQRQLRLVRGWFTSGCYGFARMYCKIREGQNQNVNSCPDQQVVVSLVSPRYQTTYLDSVRRSAEAYL